MLVDLADLGYPGYQLSKDGEVSRIRDGRVLKTSTNQYGVERVGLMNPITGKQETLSVTRLVAVMYVPGRSDTFDTPINLNGNRLDNRAINIMWRPRWFAVNYFRQFKDYPNPMMSADIVDLENGREFADTRSASVAYGFLEADVLKSVISGSPCFPDWHIFARKTS